MFHLVKRDDPMCQDLIVSFYRYVPSGTVTIAETRVRCWDGPSALRIARYELGKVCADCMAWVRLP